MLKLKRNIIRIINRIGVTGIFSFEPVYKRTNITIGKADQ